MLTTLKYICTGIQRLSHSQNDNCCDGQHSSSFHAFISTPSQPQQSCHKALELDEVLFQVFKRLDSSTLCTSVPLVCQHWKAAAASDQIWAPRCDPQLLAVLNQQHPTAHAAGSDPNPAAGAASTPALSSTQGSHASCRQALQPCQHSRSCRTTPGPCHRVPLPLLHHAVYSFNLLRNPEFVAAANADYSASLQQRLARLAAGSSSQKPAMVTSEQRKFAWVTTVGRPSWEVLPALDAAGVQPPVALRYPLSPSNSTSLQLQLQGWLFRRAGSSAVAATQSPAYGNAGSSAATAEQQAEQQQLSYLETGNSWAEVVQVIDLMGELTARGLDPATAAAVLDSGALCVALTFWVAAAPGSNSSSGSPPSTPVRNASAASGPTCGGASSSSGSTHDVRHATPAQFAAALMLDDGQVPLRSFQTFVVTESSHHFFSKRLAVQPGEAWRRYVYVVPTCPKGMRRAVVLLRGRGQGCSRRGTVGDLAAAAQPSLGPAISSGGSSSGGSDESSGSSGGVRFACAQLAFIRRDEVDGLGADDCLAGWQDRVVQGA